jgi:hypothetical protein
MTFQLYRLHTCCAVLVPRLTSRCYNIDLKNIITKVEVKLEIETKLIIGINTLLDIVSITL